MIEFRQKVFSEYDAMKSLYNELMKKEQNQYEAPFARVVDTRLELSFLQSQGGGNIDPGTDDPWGDF